MLTIEQKESLDEKVYFLEKFLDLRNDNEINFAYTILLLGLGCRNEDLKEKDYRQYMESCDDFLYRYELGKLIEKYLPADFEYNLCDPTIFKIAERLGEQQDLVCALNIQHRLKMCVNAIKNYDKSKMPENFKNEVFDQVKKCIGIFSKYKVVEHKFVGLENMILNGV